MTTFRKILSLVLALTMLVSMAACNNGEQTPETTGTAVNEGETGTYSVSVKTAGGMAMSGVDVYVYADSSKGDLKQYGETNEDGKVSFQLPKSGDYAVELSGVPRGYEVESYYSFSGNAAEITLTSALISDENLTGATLGLGDVMYDFSVVTPEGETITLSEMLKEKEMVLLNFWYTGCSWCVTEFPIMEEVYQEYSDKVGILALDPMPTDNDEAIRAFQANMGLSFPMASCPIAWATSFGIASYPTSVIIDRYGVISLIEVGAIVSKRPFTCLFDHFTGEDYEQKLCSSVADLITEAKPTYTMPTTEEISAAIDGCEMDITYRPETEDANWEYSWPFIITEKNGETCLKASNQEIDGSFAILYADVYLKAGQALGFDYLSSTERGADVMVVIMENDDIFQISGVPAEETWSSCFPWVAEEDGYYELALCYIKDDSTNEGDDTVYIKNMRVVDAADVDTATYLPRLAATTEDGFEYNYVDIVLNEKDGYYHVGSENGPLLLADLMGYTQFNEEKTVFDLTEPGDIKLDGVSIYERLVKYCSYASNASLNGICTVNADLAELLKVVAREAGFSDDENEWLKICKYYQVYGSDEQLQDPIKGLAKFSAFEAKLGKNVATNYFYYDRPIIPRGLLAKFVPAKSGVYRINSHSDSEHGVEAWIFDEEHDDPIYTYAHDERMNSDHLNCSMVYYMEKGKAYYINIAYWDYYGTGTIPYDIEYLGASYDLFRACSPGYFTYDSDATGAAMYYLIHGGIDVVLGKDGYYYEDLGLDAKGNQKYGSKIYADFEGVTSLFSTPITSVYAYDENGKVIVDENGNKQMVTGMLDMGGFDFSKSGYDLEILAYLEKHDGDVDATREYLRTLWAESYDEYAAIYQVEDVFEGIYHGAGEDLTEEVRAYVSKIEKKPAEKKGCVAVDERLAEILQMLMDKYTFENVENSWLKVCYYYDHLG